jgi:leader peptidase (prepilin peptidase)/N-methyltransferase
MALQGRGLFDFIFWLVMIVGFVALALYDIRWYLLPDVIVFPLIALAFIQVSGDALLFEHSWQAFTGPLFGVVAISGTFLALYAVSRGTWIGFGDVKLGIILGLLAGGALRASLVLLAASLLGTLVALPLVIQGRATRKTHLPFGPLLLAGLVLVVLFGTGLVDWYTDLLSV